jgi:hypothetical protein
MRPESVNAPVGDDAPVAASSPARMSHRAYTRRGIDRVGSDISCNPPSTIKRGEEWVPGPERGAPVCLWG